MVLMSPIWIETDQGIIFCQLVKWERDLNGPFYGSFTFYASNGISFTHYVSTDQERYRVSFAIRDHIHHGRGSVLVLSFS